VCQVFCGFNLVIRRASKDKELEKLPTALYTLLQTNIDVRISTDFSAFRPGSKDMLDA
jgi:hypothetical protein